MNSGNFVILRINIIINTSLAVMLKSALALIALSLTPSLVSAQNQYALNFPEDSRIQNSGRSLTAVKLNSPTHGEQSAESSQSTDRLLYHDCTSTTFKAVAGETVTASFDWTGDWMHGYIYIDIDNDGQFDTSSGGNQAIADGKDVMTFSNYNGVNSIGTVTDNGNVGVNPPAFVIPSDMAPGTYRMRYKIDWNSIDPGGNNADSQSILKNGGAITDVTLVVEAAQQPESPYMINFSKDSKITHAERKLHNITFSSPSDGMQTLASTQASDKLLYHDNTDKCFSATAGETVKVSYEWTGTWMHGYVYLDRGNDGVFSHGLGNNSSIPAGSDVMAFTYVGGYNSEGKAISNSNTGVNPPAFTVPASLNPGLYRLRLKIDWDSVDPAGNPGSNGGANSILSNGGAITDVMLYVHKQMSSITVSSANGTVTTVDGDEISMGTVIPGENLVVKIMPDEGYRFDAITISSGYDTGSDKVAFVDPSLNNGEHTVPGFLATDGIVTVPASMLRGNVKFTAHFIANDGSGEKDGNYECSLSGTKQPDSGITAVTVDGKSAAIDTPQNYFYLKDTAFGVMPGETVAVSAAYNGQATRFSIYVDYDSNGIFSAVDGALTTELATTAASADALPAFQIPALLPAGVYRARLEAEGHCAVDFLLNVHNAEGALDVKAMNGNVLANDGNSLPLTVAYGTALRVKPQATLPGYSAREVIVRHGHNLNGPSHIKGNPQWTDTTLPYSSTVTIPAGIVDGDVDIYVLYTENSDSEWTKVWGDEFNGNSLDPNRWCYQSREGATWNRLVAQGDEIPYVNIVADGRYNSYCIGTPDEFKDTENQNMISGAINSQGLFHLTYGKVEARIKTRRHTGNFPAFWMMPMDNSKGWPKDGEIDIWEQIDDTHMAHHTIHSGWSGWNNYCHYPVAPKQYSPANSGNEYMDQDLWHVYAIEWDAEEIRWYVDGVKRFSYANMHYSESDDPESPYTEEITWPFYKDFYIILNQSVGNGAWAAWCDPEFTYLTEFDYVRVYKKKGDDVYTTKLDDNGDDPNFYVPAKDQGTSITDITMDSMEGLNDNTPATYYDLHGRRTQAGAMTPGVYIEKCGEHARKVLIK